MKARFARRDMALLRIPALLAALLIAPAGIAQQDVPFNFGIPLAPLGLANQPLPDGPFMFKTGEDMDIRVVIVTNEIEFPWSLAFLPDGDMLVTTRPGLIRVIRDGVLDPEPVAGGPESFWTGISGLPGAVHGYQDIALHPEFAANSLIYLTYTKPIDSESTVLGLGRGRWDGAALQGFEDIYVGHEESQGPSRMAFGRDGSLYFTASGGYAQALDNIGGKVLRINDDGSIPDDNPFVGKEGALAEVYTFGHRSSLGLAVHPGTGDVWQHENGPNGGDEINVLASGANYGWPLVSLGRTYPGPWQDGEAPSHEGHVPPIVYWMPAIALSGMAFYTGDALPKWKGDVFVGGLRYGEIPGTGQLQRILFNQNMEELRREVLLAELRQRIRDVRQGPDELLYVLTDEQAGAVLRIEPAL
ncbi:PQQ-dependent sugar dehydrogenase [Candidatus Rariloculus sp.]|uniref:PQQ-dependent sugar dehydrogenase n=1 Tax=Candidatus Rariloculus sp. TaxID=3101265 RepID=UPI003D0D27F2